MPAVESWLAAPPTAPADSFADAPEDFPGQPASGDDFDRVMQATLAPPSAKSPAKNFSRAERNPPPAGKFTSAAAPDTSANKKNSETRIAGEKLDDTAGVKKKSAANADGTTSANVSLQSGPVETTEPLPLILALSFFSGSAEFLAHPEKAGAMEKTPSAGTNATGKVAPAVLPLAAASLALAGKAERPADGTENNLPLKNFSPVTSAEAETLAAALKDNSNGTGVLPEQNEANRQDACATTKADGGMPNLNFAFQPDADSAEKKTDLNSAMTAQRAAENAGTGVAITASPMKNPQKANKVAGPDVKVLPVGDNGGARAKNFPTPLLVTPVRTANNGGTDLNFSFSNGNSQSPMTAGTPVLNVADLPSLADARLRAVERTHDMMSLHAMRLVESKSDALSVVIKPSVGTELSLELRQRDGGVEAQATLTRGDREFLSQHWPELQQRLEQRGIKLAPLAGETDFSANGNGNFQRQQTSQEQAAQEALAFAEFVSITASGGASARRAAIHDGWESWA
jgi:hypothetical protein